MYGELVAVRDRLAGLPPVAEFDLENAAQAMAEIVWYLAMVGQSRKQELALDDGVRDRLVAASQDRDADLYVMIVAVLASKLANRRGGDYANEQVSVVRDALDALTFDFREPKRATLAAFKAIREDLEDRARYVRAQRPSAYSFGILPEKYAARKNKSERPDAFFRRVYQAHVARGLTQADIRRADPAFYNVLHVWCVRNKKLVSNLVPATRRRGG